MLRMQQHWFSRWLVKDRSKTNEALLKDSSSYSQSMPAICSSKNSTITLGRDVTASDLGSVAFSKKRSNTEKKESLKEKKRKIRVKESSRSQADGCSATPVASRDSLPSLPSERTAFVRNRPVSVGSFSHKNSRGGNAKKVDPPVVPEVAYPRNSSSSFGSGSSSSASGYYTSTTLSDNRSSYGLDDGATAPSSPSDVSVGKLSVKDGMEGNQARGLSSPNRTGTGQVFAFPPTHQGLASLAKHEIGQPSSPFISPTAYGHQSSLEDQGIDMAQSPGRESPSSTTTSSSANRGGPPSGPNCRSSSTSLDSGRASYGNVGNQNNQPANNRLSGHSYETSSSSSLRHSYHSSNSSLGSGHEICRMNVVEMLAQGVPDHEVLNAWLSDMGFEEYYDLFVQSGYDMHTIIRMTPEDLTAIGITKPNHRKRLKTEIGNLLIPDGLPDYIPDTLEEWLSLLALAEYSPSLRRQGYRTVEDVSQLTWEDLEDFGILRLGHQKKIILAIKRVKDIMSGKWTPNMQENPVLHTQFIQQRELPTSPHHAPSAFGQFYQVPQTRQPCQSRTQNHYAAPSTLGRPVNQYGSNVYSQPIYQPDVIAIQVHNTADGKPVDRTSTHNSFYADPRTLKQPPVSNNWRRRSYEEGDISPRQEGVALPSISEQYSSGTLPRQRGQVKVRPVAKIAATRTDSDPNMAETEACLKQLSLQSEFYEKQMSTDDIYELKSLTPKKSAPLPPKRSLTSDDASPIYARLPMSPYQLSGSHTVQLSSLPLNGVSRLSESDLPLPPDPILSDDSDDFPPPPAPMCASDSYIQQGQVAASVRERLECILQRTGAGNWPKITSPPGNGKNVYGNASQNQMLRSKSRDQSPGPDCNEGDVNTGEFRQRRNGSNDSFKSSSSTESESMPFANENAGTIKQRSSRQHPALSGMTYSSQSPGLQRRALPPYRGALSVSPNEKVSTTSQPEDLESTVDVLTDIGSMLAGLTNELDAMLEQEIQQQTGGKR